MSIQDSDVSQTLLPGTYGNPKLPHGIPWPNDGARAMAEEDDLDKLTRAGLPAIARSQGIISRAHFMTSLVQVNEQARKGITPENAQISMRKAEALRAWAQFDSNLSADDKKEANRAILRTVKALAELAQEVQPSNRRARGASFLPGAPTWLMKTLNITKRNAQAMCLLARNEILYRSLLDSGRPWKSAGHQAAPTTALSSFNSWACLNGPMQHAVNCKPQVRLRSLRAVRKLLAWGKAYEANLIELIAKDKKENTHG